MPRLARSTNIQFASGVNSNAEVASTYEELTAGLSGRDCLRRDSAMLFVFPGEDYWGIWMSKMKFSIDVVWLNQNKEVVHVIEGMSPSSFPRSFSPKRRRYMLLSFRQAQ